MEDWSPNCGHCGKLHGPNTPICYPGKKQENEMTTHKDRPHASKNAAPAGKGGE